MKKLIFLLLACIAVLPVNAQVYTSAGSTVSFFSKAPLEDIHAVNKDAKSLIDLVKKEVAMVIGIRSFHFEKPLMEEHFNENYMESHKYKTAVFKGKINENVDLTKDGTYNVTATGKLNIHGVEQTRTIKGTLTVKGNKITLHSKFPVALKDHNIKVPSAVIKNIAEVVEVTADFTYIPKK